jgi:hypothetical protein
MMRIAAIFALITVACTPVEFPEGYPAGEVTPPAPDCVPAADIDADSGRIVEDVIICGELGAGAVDTFTVVNAAAEGRELSVQTFGGSGCDTDTDIAVRTLGGELITFDEQLGIGECAWVTIFVEGRQSVSVEVIAQEAGPYRLAVELFTL